jgi:hypothetical protein
LPACWPSVMYALVSPLLRLLMLVTA